MNRIHGSLRRQIKNRLLNHGSPRIQMCLILLFTALSAFAASAVMANLGVHRMWIRYLVAMLAAYGGFILCLNIWVRYALSQEDFTGEAVDGIEDAVDVVDAADDLSSGVGSMTRSQVNVPTRVDISEGSSSSGGGSSSGIGDLFSVDLDEGAVIIIALIIVLSLLVISIYLVYIAPVFLGEILFNAAVMSGFYRRIRTLQKESWMMGAIRGSWIPFAVAGAIVVAGGYAIQWINPDIETIGDIVRIGFSR